MKKYNKQIIILSLIIIIFLLWYFDIFKYISIEYISELKDFINNFGILGPIVFFVIYVLATVLFLPGLPLSLLAGIVFGPILGSILVSISSTTGAALAFLVGRYTGRDWIINKFSDSDIFKKLDNGIKEQGWRMIAITRLIPIFPFNAQNYVYGLTDIDFKTYVFVSWLCMLPGTVAYVFLAGAIIAGEGNTTKTITYIGIGVAILLILSVVGKRFVKNSEEENK